MTNPIVVLIVDFIILVTGIVISVIMIKEYQRLSTELDYKYLNDTTLVYTIDTIQDKSFIVK